MDRSGRPGNGANAFRFTVDPGYGLDYGGLTRWLPARVQGIAAVVLIHSLLILLAFTAPRPHHTAKPPVLTYLTFLPSAPPKPPETSPASVKPLQPIPSPGVAIQPPLTTAPTISAQRPAVPPSDDALNAACQRRIYGVPLPPGYVCPEPSFVAIIPGVTAEKSTPAKKPTEREVEAAREARFNALNARFGPKEAPPVSIDNDRTPMIASQSWQKTEQWRQEYTSEKAPIVKKIEEEVLPDILLRDNGNSGDNK